MYKAIRACVGRQQAETAILQAALVAHAAPLSLLNWGRLLINLLLIKAIEQPLQAAAAPCPRCHLSAPPGGHGYSALAGWPISSASAQQRRRPLPSPPSSLPAKLCSAAQSRPATAPPFCTREWEQVGAGAAVAQEPLRLCRRSTRPATECHAASTSAAGPSSQPASPAPPPPSVRAAAMGCSPCRRQRSMRCPGGGRAGPGRPGSSSFQGACLLKRHTTLASKPAFPTCCSSPSRGLRGSEEGSTARHLRTQGSGVPAAVLLSSPGALRAAGWGALHALLGLGTAKYWAHLNKQQRELYFLYYQPFLPMLAMLWLWGTAVRFWERRRIRYDVCFSAEDQRYLLRSEQLFQVGACCCWAARWACTCTAACRHAVEHCRGADLTLAAGLCGSIDAWRTAVVLGARLSMPGAGCPAACSLRVAASHSSLHPCS